MSAPAKGSSRWGSFLQQAVAGVESRLDNILADGIEEPVPQPQKKITSPILPVKTESGLSRTASTSSTGNRTNDRLQERLARAIAAKNTAQKADRADSLALSSGVPLRTGSPITFDSPRRSVDGVQVIEGKTAGGRSSLQAKLEEEGKEDEVGFVSRSQTPDTQDQPRVQEVMIAKSDVEPLPRISIDSAKSHMPRASMDSISHSAPQSSMDVQSTEVSELSAATTRTPAEYESLITQLQLDFEAAELSRQEEIHDYIERIDTLQSKLQYLAKETAEAARKTSEAAPSGSLEKKLADKEEQVALLMEEGQKLSNKELTLHTTIKKLRSKIQEDTKEVSEVKAKQEKAEKDVAIITERWKKSQTAEKRLNERQKLVDQLQNDVQMLRSENNSKDSTITELKRHLAEVTSQAKQTEAKATQESLLAEKKRVTELEDGIANLKIEKHLVVDRAQAQIKEMRERMKKESERIHMIELEMKSEQQILESKLEVMRARAEEVSSGATGDAQAKLLRQIETLQSQYAVASDNWQGIEASLVGRATNLEKERDEATKREADIRRKAREMTLKAKRNEDELEETNSKLPGFEQKLKEYKTKTSVLQQKAEEAEQALFKAQSDYEQERQAWKSEVLNRIEEERQKWQEEMSRPNSAHYSRADSPVTSTRRGLTSEFLGLQNLQMRRASRSVNNDAPSSAGIAVHRPSIQPLGRSSGNGTPVRQDSTQSFTRENGENGDKASILTSNDREDDFFDNSPTSPHKTINDMVSISTAGAGPSVQLVERMSSAVRRLESEKVATKEDISRLAAQRDEARAEIVSLMKEVKSKRAVDEKVKELERDIGVVKQRYETTLEMLGEKSEEVEELKGDVEDLKGMYRELVERTVK